ncbi:MAG: hypothetical protein ACPHCI_06940, partial [Solirubrobacterales bacterium]
FIAIDENIRSLTDGSFLRTCLAPECFGFSKCFLLDLPFPPKTTTIFVKKTLSLPNDWVDNNAEAKTRTYFRLENRSNRAAERRRSTNSVRRSTGSSDLGQRSDEKQLCKGNTGQ